jgi:hypothetical protein
MKVAEHMMRKFDEPHMSWMEGHGLNPLELSGVSENEQGNYRPLATLLDKIAQEKR